MCRQGRLQPPRPISMLIVMASNGLCNTITRNVPKPASQDPAASHWTAAASATPLSMLCNASPNAAPLQDKSEACGVVIVGVIVMVVLMVVIVLMFRVVGHIVMMEAEESFDEEHHQHAGQQRDRDPANGFGTGRQGDRATVVKRRRADRASRFGSRGGVDDCVRQHVEHADSQHYAGDEAHGELHPAVRQLKPDGNHAADNRRDEDQCAIIGQQYGGHVVRSTGCRGQGIGPRASNI